MSKWFISPIILLLILAISATALFAQNVPSNVIETRDTDLDFNLAGNNENFNEMSYINNLLYIWDWVDDKFYSYDPDTKLHTPVNDISVPDASGRPCWDGTHFLFLVNSGTATMYDIEGNQAGTITFNNSNDTKLCAWDGSNFWVVSQRNENFQWVFDIHKYGPSGGDEIASDKITKNYFRSSGVIQDIYWDGNNLLVIGPVAGDNSGATIRTIATNGTDIDSLTTDHQTHSVTSRGANGPYYVLNQHSAPFTIRGYQSSTPRAPLPTAPPLPTGDPQVVPPFTEPIVPNGIYTPTAPVLSYTLQNNVEDDTMENVVFRYTQVSGVDNYEIYGIPSTGTEIIGTTNCNHTVFESRTFLQCDSTISQFTISVSGSGMWEVSMRGRRSARSEDTYIPRADGTSAYIAPNTTVYTPYSTPIIVNYYQLASVTIPPFTPNESGDTTGLDNSTAAQDDQALKNVVSALGQTGGLQENQIDELLLLLWFSGAIAAFAIPTAASARYRSTTIGAALGSGLATIMLLIGPFVFTGIPIWTAMLPLVFVALFGVFWLIGRLGQNK